MCLNTKTNKPSIAKEDFVAYKCFRSVKERYSSKKYRDMYTLFLDVKVPYDEMTGKAPFVGKDKAEPVCDKDNGGFNVGKGYIHVYRDYATAKRVVRERFIGVDWYFPVITEVTIPKGTEYFEGEDALGMPSIAAEKIVIGECKECLVGMDFHNYNDYVSALEKKAVSKERQPFE